MTNSKWTINHIPDQYGQCIIITGANSGIGFEAALALAGKGAEVILAVRNLNKSEQAIAQIRQTYSQANVAAMPLDLADLGSIRNFADSFAQQHTILSVLINNAGVMGIPYRQTVDGFEMQFGTNHLGHFALTGLLLPLLVATPQSRVVTVSSLMHQFGKIALDNLNGVKKYAPWLAYGQSKLANLLFAYELQRRLAQASVDTISLGCHPGYAATNLQFEAARMNRSRFAEIMNRLANRLFAQSAAMGALPTLYAATSPDVSGGDFIGPLGMGGAQGYPGKAQSSARSHDTVMAQELWHISEQLTGVRYTALDHQGSER